MFLPEKYFSSGLVAKGGFIFVLLSPLFGCAVCYLFHVSMIQHTERGNPAAHCPSSCHQMSSADASDFPLSQLTEGFWGLLWVGINSPESHPRGTLHPERCLSSFSKGPAWLFCMPWTPPSLHQPIQVFLCADISNLQIFSQEFLCFCLCSKEEVPALTDEDGFPNLIQSPLLKQVLLCKGQLTQS